MSFIAASICVCTPTSTANLNIARDNLYSVPFITVMGGLAQEESTSISQNMRWSVRKRMENGTYEPSSVPFGYVKKEGRLAIDPPKAEIVRMIYQLYLSGNGLLKIANILNERNIPTITNCPKWQIYPIKYILKNEKYVGDMLLQKYYNTEIVPFKKLKNNGERDQYLIRDSHEPIISRNDFERVQYIMNVKGRIYYNSIRSKSVFSSIIKCGKCGTSFKRKCDNGKYYWVCRNHDENSQDCDVKQIPEETIRKSFIYMFNKLMIHYREILLPLRRSLHELNSRRFNGNIKMLDIRKNIADIKEQRHVISRLRKRGFIDEKKYNEKLSELESQLARQERELKNVSKADTENDTLEQLDTLIDCIEIRQAILTEFDEELFTMIVKKIIVKDNVLEFGLISDIKLKENI